MSFATWNFLKIYAKIRESYLRLNPHKRLFPDDDPSDDASGIPFISVGEKGKKIGLVIMALVALLALSNRE